MSLSKLFSRFSLMPVVVIDNADDAVPLAESLLEGGIRCIEITLRTDAALDAIYQVSKYVPDIINGVGTVINAKQMCAAEEAGAVFQVSPGMSPSLAKYAEDNDIHWLAGVTDASQIMLAKEYNVQHMKFFPASLSGGVPMLKQFASVFPDVTFCPTGGISLENMNEYAALPNVFAIGGSWLTPKEAIAAKDFKRITQICKDTMAQLKRA
jgi:2-dehydro-3-deoxyphosphogluconate aldolase / (4S)-4-hydroxy-2-oxoglutarate aldolase